jgi:hypothetical protein
MDLLPTFTATDVEGNALGSGEILDRAPVILLLLRGLA